MIIPYTYITSLSYWDLSGVPHNCSFYVTRNFLHFFSKRIALERMMMNKITK